MEDCFKGAGIRGSVTGLGSLFRIHATDRELMDYRSTRLDAAESQQHGQIVRNLLEHGVLVAPTGTMLREGYTEQGGDDGGRTAAGGESTFRNGGAGSLALADQVV